VEGQSSTPQTLERLLAEAADRIERRSARDAYAAMQAGALLVDIRSSEDRERDGVVPGSLHIPRTVLEWRVAPDSDWRSPHVGGLDREIILICDHGDSTVFATATLLDLGFTKASDVIGGFLAWKAAGLPVASAPSERRGGDELAGMRGPDEGL
jgi:rhodanese-related sulfurtransferase